MRNILVVEDNKDINQIIKDTLKEQGYNVYQTYNAIEALKIFDEVSFDCIITDLMLPLMSGEELIKLIREKSKIHIIVISAKTSISDKLEGLKIGADDYLYKPFVPEEIVYKLSNLFAKNTPVNTLILDNDVLEFTKNSNHIHLNKNSIELTSVEYRIMEYLFLHKNQVISRDQLLNTLYDYDEEVFDRVIDVHIKNIRQKMKKHSKNDFIKTVYGLGYKLIGDEND